jgi:hypothetical protein
MQAIAGVCDTPLPASIQITVDTYGSWLPVETRYADLLDDDPGS